jgi:hypothetical protein
MRSVRNRLRTMRQPSILPSLYDRYPHASSATRRMRGLQIVPVERIVGTTRHPSQVTDEFLPLPELRGQNWRSRSQRIRAAVDRLAVLPPVDLIKVGDDYFVTDGHNRVAAAREAGMVGIDADVTELIIPGVAADPAPESSTTSLLENRTLRDAGAGRLSPTAERHLVDDLEMRPLIDGDDPS